MNFSERIRQEGASLLEMCKQELSLVCTIALGSAALTQMVDKPAPDPRDVAAYENLRATELDVYAYAQRLQREGLGSRAAANSVDKLGQELTNERGALEDKLDENTSYFET